MGDHRRVQRSTKQGQARGGGGTPRRACLYGAGVAAIAGLASWQLWSMGRSVAGIVTTDTIGDQVQTLPKDRLPEFAAGGDLGRLYRYAVDHGDELQYIPCTCGCARFGHKSNRDCYIKSLNKNGTLTFTSHAAT